MMAYFVLEGIDGSSKDTQADLLVKELIRRQIEAPFVETGVDGVKSKPLPKGVISINEPDSSSPTGILLRQCLKSGDHKRAHAAMFLADRMVLHFGKILPALEFGEDVVCCRSLMSTLVYQQEQWPLDWLIDIHRMIPTKVDLLFVLDVDPAVGLARVGKRGADLEVYEQIDIQERNRQRYLDLVVDPRMRQFLSPNGHIVVIDTNNKSIGAIHTEVLAAVDHYQTVEPHCICHSSSWQPACPKHQKP